jgi:hypothetical protein
VGDCAVSLVGLGDVKRWHEVVWNGIFCNAGSFHEMTGRISFLLLIIGR